MRGFAVRSALLLLASCVALAAEPGQRLSFVACPIVRDTSSVPCWLAEYQGELYFLTLQTDVSAPVNPPWLGHRVLVEGVIADGPQICGGRVLEPVALSVMQELDASCNTMLPAEDRYDLTFEPPRPPGPSRGRLAFGDPAARASELPREITLQYEFDGMVAFRHAQKLQQALDAARKFHAREVRITGYRSASRLSDGTVMRERASLGRERAAQVEELLRGAGLEGVRFTLRTEDRSKRPDQVHDAANRRVDIVIVGGE
jgi:hypothetical protein